MKARRDTATVPYDKKQSESYLRILELAGRLSRATAGFRRAHSALTDKECNAAFALAGKMEAYDCVKEKREKR